MIQRRIRILSHLFKIVQEPFPHNGIEKISPQVENYSIPEKRILLNSEYPEDIQEAGLFHAISEILLALTGQYFNHEGFSGYAYLLYSTLRENNLLVKRISEDE